MLRLNIYSVLHLNKSVATFSTSRGLCDGNDYATFKNRNKDFSKNESRDEALGDQKTYYKQHLKNKLRLGHDRQL